MEIKHFLMVELAFVLMVGCSTKQPEPTLMLSPTDLATQITVSPTSTPVSYDKWTLVENLFQRDKSCRVPCFFGFIPGITTWTEAKEFLSNYQPEIRDNGSTPNNWSMVGVEFLYMKDGKKPIYVHNEIYMVNNSDIIEVIGLTTPTYDSLHSFTSFLQSYGKPYSVWINTFNESYAGNIPFEITFFYQQEKILIVFLPDEKTWNENEITACFRNPYEASIYIWDANKEKSFDIANKDIMNSEKYLALETATNMNVDSLWDSINNPNDPLCVTTPKNLWPPQ